jgi:putative sensory transduction regulator
MRVGTVILISALASQAVVAQRVRMAPQAVAAKIAPALEQSGLHYRKANETTWAVTFEAHNRPSINVVVNAQTDIIIVLAVVADRPQLTQPQLSRLLRISYETNYAKMVIDNDGDLLALTEVSPDSLTPSSLREAIENVFSAADSAIASLRVTDAPNAGGREGLVERSPSAAATSLTLLRGLYELTYDTRKWRLQDTKDATVMQLSHVSGDAFVRVIAERIQVESEAFRDVALNNAKQIAPDIQLESETPRVVNGLQTLVLRYSGKTSGVRFTFLNQMHSDAGGTVQLAGWTGSNLFDEYRGDFLELFNGLRRTR